MFGKLIKHEIKAAGKWYLLTYVVTLGLSLFFGLSMKTWLGKDYSNVWFNNDFGNLRTNLQIFTLIALVILAFGLIMATLFLIVNRFYNNIYGREGYLTMTLPVTTHQIILSKLVAATIWMLLSTLTCIISFTLYIMPSMKLAELLTALHQVISNFNDHVPIPLFLISLLVSNLAGVLLIYLAISIGQLFQNRRGLMGFVSYLALQIVINFLTSFITPKAVYWEFFGTSYFVFILIVSSIKAIIFYATTNYIMKTQLNIQ